MEIIYNLTKRMPTTAQIAAGVRARTAEEGRIATNLLSFELREETDLSLQVRANGLYELLSSMAEADLRKAAKGSDEALSELLKSLVAPKVLVGGNLALMLRLVPMLKARGLKPVTALEEREVIKTLRANGKVEECVIFKHCGWQPL